MKHILLLILIPLLTACSHNKSGYLNFDQGKIYYETYGKGEPIIVLHGGTGMSHDLLMPHMLALTKDHKVTFYDQRGSGKSTNTIYDEKHISDEQLVKDLDALRKSLGYEKVILLGDSYAGRIVMEYAIAHPEHVKSMILSNTSAATLRGNKAFVDGYYKASKDQDKEFEALAQDPDTNRMWRNYFKLIFSVYFYDKTKLEQLKLPSTDEAINGYHKTYAIIFKDYYTKPFDLRPELAKLTIPTLVIHGDHDLIPLFVAKEIHAAMPVSELVIIKDSGHFTFIEKPNEFFGVINEFLMHNNQK